MPTIWNIAPKSAENLRDQLLINRGLTSPLDQTRFFNPSLTQYEELLTIPGIPEARDRIRKAIDTGELIIVYGDYDVDGISASAISYHALKSLGANVLPYIPHREKEGYGLSNSGIDTVAVQGAKLILTVDQGIVAFDQVIYAKSLGLDVIVTDHHAPTDQFPKADVIVHSTQMCGAVVAWSLFRGMIDPQLAQQLLQFACLGTICDMIPLVGLGRAIVKEGLKELRKTTYVGMRALMIKSGLVPSEVGAFDVGFMLGPRLNAAGRMDHAIDGLRLLCTQNPKRADELADKLTQMNAMRQRLTANAYDDAKLQIVKEHGIYVLHSKDWAPGIIGLVASKVCEEFNRPVIAISEAKEHSKGSARAAGGLNIIETLRGYQDMMVALGGHSGAAGFTIHTDKLEQFKQSLVAQISADSLTDKVMDIDAEVGRPELSFDLIKTINEFEPFGMGNPKPILATKQMRLEDVRTVGSGKHLKLSVDGIDGIGFGMGSQANVLAPGKLVNVAYYPEINSFNGRRSLQLKIKDIQV